MAVIDIAVICLLAICVVLGLGEPFVRRDGGDTSEPAQDGERERLLLHKEMVYGAIRDLDFDFQTSKVDQADYTELRQQLEDEAVQILRKLDTVDPQWMFENAVEQHIRALRNPAACPGETTACCPGCGASSGHDGNFCAFCGQALRHA